MKPQSLIKFVLALLVVRILLAAFTPVFDTSEARYAAISANMTRSNDFLVPHFTHNHVYQSFDGKPPLLFQAAGLSVKALGVNEFAVRLPVLLASALFLLLVFRVTLVLSAGNRACAGLATMLTFASTVFYTQAGFCMTDGLLVPCVAGALLCHAAFLKTRERNWTWGVFGLLGLGMLVKGPVALVEFGIPVALDLAVNRRWAALRAYRWLTGGTLFLLIAAPWFILMTRENPDFLRYFFIHENLLRFLVHDYGDKYGAGRETFRGMALVWTLVATLPLVMFARNVELSIRGRMILWSLVASCIITFSSFFAIFFVTHQQMHGRVDEDMDMILSDLEDEYAQYGGLSEKLRACILEDVDEHNIAITQIFVLAPDGRTLFSTQALKNPRHPIRTWSLTLSDGNTIQIKRDIDDLREFDIFLALLLSAIGLVSISCVGVFSAFLGGRILKLNQTVQEKNRAIEELKTLTDDIAHDLRTPLTRLNIAAEASLVKGDGLALVEQVSQESMSMLEMIDTMLEISQSSFRIDRAPRETLDLALLVQQSADIYRQLAEDKNITLKVDVPNRPVTFSGHKAKLQQMIGNLLDNALKFTPEGGTITMALIGDEKGTTLNVDDTGCGIGKDDLPHIFQRFYRADSSRSLPGNGLGLALVHAIVTSYGGRITCHSALNQGTTFEIQLPTTA